jgi:hypothetical protein
VVTMRVMAMTDRARLGRSRNEQRHFDVPAGHARALNVRAKPAVLLDGSADIGDAILTPHLRGDPLRFSASASSANCETLLDHPPHVFARSHDYVPYQWYRTCPTTRREAVHVPRTGQRPRQLIKVHAPRSVRAVLPRPYKPVDDVYAPRPCRLQRRHCTEGMSYYDVAWLQIGRRCEHTVGYYLVAHRRQRRAAGVHIRCERSTQATYQTCSLTGANIITNRLERTGTP